MSANQTLPCYFNVDMFKYNGENRMTATTLWSLMYQGKWIF